MGYRSEVVIAFVFENQTAVNMFGLTVNQPKYNEILEDLQGMTWTKDDDGTVYAVYTADSIKWYPDYKYVQQFNALLVEIGDAFAEVIGAKYVRVGEDDSDIETEYYGWDASYEFDLYPRTYIECSVGGESPMSSPLVAEEQTS